MNIGIFGGTFDPIHNGHILTAEDVLNTLKLDLIYFMPNKQPYYKQNKISADELRLKLISLAIESFPKFKVSDFEIRQNKYSYTYDLMQKLHQKFSNDNLVFIMGMDSFLNLGSWHNGYDLLNITNIALMHRPTYELKNLALKDPKLHNIFQQHISPNYELNKKFGQLFLVPNRSINISSTELRLALKNMQYDFAAPYLDSKVLEYLKK